MNTQQMYALQALAPLLPQGATIYAIFRAVSRSGLTKTVDLAVVHEGKIQRIGYFVAGVLARSYDGFYNGITVKSEHEDAAGEIVKELEAKLFPNGDTCGNESALNLEWL
jgi:hypothetical protein